MLKRPVGWIGTNHLDGNSMTMTTEKTAYYYNHLYSSNQTS